MLKDLNKSLPGAFAICFGADLGDRSSDCGSSLGVCRLAEMARATSISSCSDEAGCAVSEKGGKQTVTVF